MQRGPHLVDRSLRRKLSLRERISAEFAALRVRLDESEKRILASLDDADTQDVA
jgi:hypothetical protein